MDLTQDLRHISPTQHLSLSFIKENVKLKKINLAALFFIQFLISPLVLSYGMYAIFLMNKTSPVFEIITPPLLLLSTSKIFNPWFRDIAESFYENHFRILLTLGTILSALGVGLCYFFTNNLLICGLLYGVLTGIGITLIQSLINSHLEDIFPYQTHLVQGIQHIGMALGLFMIPHLIQFLFETYIKSSVFLIQGAILIHLLPAGLLFGKMKSQNPDFKAYNNLGSTDPYEEEMVTIASQPNINLIAQKSWKNPSDNNQLSDDEMDFEEHENVDSESSPLPSHRLNFGQNALPQIIEEDEIDSDDENGGTRRSSILLNENIKRMSVISMQFEELITEVENNSGKPKETKDEVTMGVANLISHSNNEQIINSPSLSNIYYQPNTRNPSCCTRYQKYRFRRRIKYFVCAIFNVTLRPLFKSLKIVEFYPCLLTNVHAMFSPLIFLNFIAFKTIDSMNSIYITDLAFMYSVIAFAYLVFLSTLPWVTEISKRNLKYLYILGCFISASGIFMGLKTTSEDYIIVSCLIYGLGFGIETYLKDTVIKETLGVNKWSKSENTLEVLSGILLVVLVLSLREFIPEEGLFNISFSIKWLQIVCISHFTMFCLWIIFPIISYLLNLVCFKNRGRTTPSLRPARNTITITQGSPLSV